jgi:PAS domain S-box-containing protein
MTQDHITPEDRLTEHIASLRSSAAGLGASGLQLPPAQLPQQAEPDFRAIVQNVNSIILCMRTDGTVLFMNNFGLNFFGFRADELLGKNVVGAIVPQTDTAGRDLAVMISDIGRNPEQYVRNENENMCRDGRRVWVSWTNKAVYAPEGELQEILCVGHDLTVRREAEKALERRTRELDERVKELNCLYDISRFLSQTDAGFEHVMQAVVEGLPGGFTHADMACAKMTIGAREFVSADYHDTAWRFACPVTAGGMRRGFIAICYRQKIFLEDGQELFPEEEKNLVGVIAEMVGHFVVRWETAQALSQSELKYKTLFESLPQKIFYKDADAVYISCNSKYAADLGIPPDSITGRTDYDFYPEELAEKFRQDDRRVIETGNMLDMEETSMRDGREITIHTIKTPVCDESGRRIGILGIFRDITQRKLIEREKLLVESTLLCNQAELNLKNEISELLLSTRDLHEILHMILVAATAKEALGFNRAFLFLMEENENFLHGIVATGALTADEAYQTWARMAEEPQTLAELFQSHKRDVSDHDAAITSLVQQIKIPLTDQDSIFTRAVFRQQSFNMLNTGELSVFDRSVLGCLGGVPFVLVPLISRGSTLGVLIADNFVTGNPIVQDDVVRLGAFANHASLAIENSRLYERLKEKVTELSLANEELGANRDKLIRYERLSVVGEMAAKIAHDIRNPMTAIGGFARRMLKKGMGEGISGNYLQIIVQEVDRLEKILGDILGFSKPSTPRFRAEDINRIINETYALMAPELERQQVQVVRQLASGIPPMMLDRDQVERVLINLIKNSLEAMPDGGILTATSTLQGQWVRIETSDTGQGIAEEDMDKIFEPFFTSKATGSGLGLTLAMQIISSHGGSMDVVRHEPCGTSVIIHLPVLTPLGQRTPADIPCQGEG